MIELNEQWQLDLISEHDRTGRRIDARTPGLVRNDHPDTAKQAATQANTGKTRKFVLDAIKNAGEVGATDEALITFGMMHGFTANSVRPRRVELVRDGLVVDSGEKRKTRSGRNAIVWRLE